MKAYIQHKDELNQKLILLALVPFTSLRESVLFTYRANETQGAIDKQSQFLASMEYYQRRVDSKRSNDIKEFIRKSILLERNGSQLATLFPTSMIIALSVDDDGETGNKMGVNDDGSCDMELNSNVFIVDGQHRMMGMIKLYDELNGLVVKTEEDEYVFDYLSNYKFNCTILVNYDLWEQGQVFVNVNFKQKPVNKSLYYEIFGSEYRENETDWERNKIYLAHKMALYLNEHHASPFFKRIKMLGTGSGYVSQAFVVESLQRHFKRGGLWYFDPDVTSSFNGKGYYATELLSFFVAIKQLFPKYWPHEDSKKGTIICKTTGFGAWVRFLGMMREDNDTLLLKQLRESAEKEEVCIPYLEQVKKRLAPLQKYGEALFGKESEFNYSSGQGAESKLYKKMLFYIQQQNTSVFDDETYPFDKDKVCEALQEYLWENPVDELEILGHHYEVENIEDFRVVQYNKGRDVFEIKSSFSIYVNVFIDNEDDTGFSMDFPAVATCIWERDGEKYALDESSIKISVDTDKFYQ